MPTPPSSSLALNGDLLAEELDLPSSPENLLLTRGSLSLSIFSVRSDTTIISLGDVSIETIIAPADKPAHVIILAPLGIAFIGESQGPVKITVLAQTDQVAMTIPRASIRASVFIQPSPSLALGLFSQPPG